MATGMELIGGPEKRDILLVPYRAEWPVRFHQERDLILEALGPVARRVDHIGSTAVPGLMAKPIVDIDVSISDPDDEPTYLPALEHTGYRLRVREPGHRMLRTEARDVHVHICAAGSDWERRHLLFRDWLRHDVTDRDRYQEVKQQLAQQQWPTMNDYADAKSPIIDDISGRAEEWARASGWTVEGASDAWPAPAVPRGSSGSRSQPQLLQEVDRSAHAARTVSAPVRGAGRSAGESPDGIDASEDVAPGIRGVGLTNIGHRIELTQDCDGLPVPRDQLD